MMGDTVLDWLLGGSVWVSTWALIVLGVVGTVVPFLPGHLLIFAAAFIPFFALDDRGGVDVWGLVVLGVALLLAQVLEWLSGAMGARWFGGTRWGAAGAFVGGLVGLAFFPFGLVLGPLIGAACFEWLFAAKTVRPATVSGVGSVIGTLTGLVLKLVLAVVMVVIFCVDLSGWNGL